MSELSELASYIAELELSCIPDVVQKSGILHILDSIGTGLGAVYDQQIQSVLKEWLKIGGENGEGYISVWGTNKKASLSTAVFLNAMMSHTLEMDDVHTNSKTHIGTVVVPAAWGMAEYLGRTGDDVLLAVICGYEVMSRIGMAFGVTSHRNKGWHVTATAGTFGAAAAAGKLLGLNKKQMTWALGLAGAQSFGTWAFLGDGTSAKVLNPARAAQVGMESALLVKAGMTGAEHILTADDGGLFSMMSDEADVQLVTEGLGEEWQLMMMDNKTYPSCRSTHCAIDGTLELCQTYEISEKNIEHIEVETYLVGYKQCGSSKGSLNPETPVNARFSTPFTVACAVMYGEVSLRQLKQDIIMDPEIRKLMHKVTVKPTLEFSDAYPHHWGCRVIIRTNDGSVYVSYMKDASGSVDKPLTQTQVKDKAVSLMMETCPDKANKLAEQILSIRKLDILPQL